jgi:hypothetical protein
MKCRLNYFNGVQICIQELEVLDVVAPACNHSTWEAEARGL